MAVQALRAAHSVAGVGCGGSCAPRRIRTKSAKLVMIYGQPMGSYCAADSGRSGLDELLVSYCTLALSPLAFGRQSAYKHQIELV